MLIDKQGKIDKSIKAFLTKTDGYIVLDKDQFLQITPSGKKIELWEGKQAFLNDSITGYTFIKGWLRKSLIATY